MTEYYIEGNSFAAPFASDTSHKYIEADSPRAAVERFVAEYKHPAGLYAAACWGSADDKNKGKPELAWYWSQAVIADKKATEGLGAYTRRSLGRESFEVDGVVHTFDPDAPGEVYQAA